MDQQQEHENNAENDDALDKSESTANQDGEEIIVKPDINWYKTEESEEKIQNSPETVNVNLYLHEVSSSNYNFILFQSMDVDDPNTSTPQNTDNVTIPATQDIDILDVATPQNISTQATIPSTQDIDILDVTTPQNISTQQEVNSGDSNSPKEVCYRNNIEIYIYHYYKYN